MTTLRSQLRQQTTYLMRKKYYNEQYETTKSLVRRGSLISESSLKADALKRNTFA
jgi:hypothetical protein